MWLRGRMGSKQIGIGHPAVKDVLNIAKNTAANRFNLVAAEGLWAIELALELQARIDTFFYAPDLLRSKNAQQKAEETAAHARRAFEVSEKTMKRIAERDTPEGLLALVEMPHWDADAIELSENALIVVSDGIEIPGNLGTLMRTADGAGVELFILINRRTRMSHPKVFRGSKGMSLRVPHVEFEQVEDAISWLTARGVRVYLADADESNNYQRMDYSGPVAIVVGNERHGVSSAWYTHGFQRIGVPMLGMADSLNVSVSASILIYEARGHKERWSTRTNLQPETRSAH